MDLRFFRIGLAAVFLASLASLGAIILFVNPAQAGALGPVLFSVAAALVLFSSLGWLGFRLRRRFVTAKNLRRILGMSLREGAMLALLLVGYLWLNRFGFFKIWTAATLLVAMVVAEYLFLRRQ